MVVDTGVNVVTSALGIVVGGFELAATSWEGHNDAISTAGIVKCVFTAAGSVAYLVVLPSTKELGR